MTADCNYSGMVVYNLNLLYMGSLHFVLLNPTLDGKDLVKNKLFIWYYFFRNLFGRINNAKDFIVSYSNDYIIYLFWRVVKCRLKN